jgi:hypothetical protein
MGQCPWPAGQMPFGSTLGPARRNPAKEKAAKWEKDVFQGNELSHLLQIKDLTF